MREATVPVHKYTDTPTIDEMADKKRSDCYIVFTKIHCMLQLQKTLITLLFETAQALDRLQRLTRAI